MTRGARKNVDMTESEQEPFPSSKHLAALRSRLAQLNLVAILARRVRFGLYSEAARRGLGLHLEPAGIWKVCRARLG